MTTLYYNGKFRLNVPTCKSALVIYSVPTKTSKVTEYVFHVSTRYRHGKLRLNVPKYNLFALKSPINMILLARGNSLKTFWAEVSIALLTSSGLRHRPKMYADVSQSKIQVATSDHFVQFCITWTCHIPTAVRRCSQASVTSHQRRL
jgi:hypothetical protein